MHDDETWLRDFAAWAHTDAELRAQLAACGGEADAQLQQLIQDNLILRWSARVLLEHVRATSEITLDEPHANSAVCLAAQLLDRRKEK